MSPAQVRRMYREQKGDNGPIRILETTIEVIPHNPLRVYNDGKRRKITVNGVPFEWECAPDPQEGGRNVTTIFHKRTPIHRHTGDPHDHTPSGVRNAIYEAVLIAFLKGKLKVDASGGLDPSSFV